MILRLPELTFCVAIFSGDDAHATDGLRLTALALGTRPPRTVRTATLIGGRLFERTKKSSTCVQLLIGVDYADNTTLKSNLLDQHASRYLLAIMLPPGLRELSRMKKN